MNQRLILKRPRRSTEDQSASKSSTSRPPAADRPKHEAMSNFFRCASCAFTVPSAFAMCRKVESTTFTSNHSASVLRLYEKPAFLALLLCFFTEVFITPGSQLRGLTAYSMCCHKVFTKSLNVLGLSLGESGTLWFCEKGQRTGHRAQNRPNQSEMKHVTWPCFKALRSRTQSSSAAAATSAVKVFMASSAWSSTGHGSYQWVQLMIFHWGTTKREQNTIPKHTQMLLLSLVTNANPCNSASRKPPKHPQNTFHPLNPSMTCNNTWYGSTFSNSDKWII